MNAGEQSMIFLYAITFKHALKVDVQQTPQPGHNLKDCRWKEKNVMRVDKYTERRLDKLLSYLTPYLIKDLA